MTWFYKIREQLVESVIHIAPSIVEWLHHSTNWSYTLADYRQFPKGTLANDIACFLDKRGFDFLPNGEYHDIRHVLLEYGTTPIDELRMQVFMVGNDLRWKITGWALVILGSVMLPELWPILKQDFKRGQKAKQLKTISWIDFLSTPTKNLRKQFNIEAKNTDLEGIMSLSKPNLKMI